MKELTVRELIDLLGRVVNKELVVLVEGCDCTARATGVDEDEAAKIVLITR